MLKDELVIIGDVHGQYKTLKKLLKQVESKNICFVGDLIDRGKDSKKVLELVMRNNYDMVLGNHELMLLGFDFMAKLYHYCIIDESRNSYYYNVQNSYLYRNGGDRTLESFGITNPGAKNKINYVILAKYCEFLKTKPVIIRYNYELPLYVSHSCIFNYIGEIDNIFNVVEDGDKTLYYIKEDFNIYQTEGDTIVEKIFWNRDIMDESENYNTSFWFL